MGCGRQSRGVEVFPRTRPREVRLRLGVLAEPATETIVREPALMRVRHGCGRLWGRTGSYNGPVMTPAAFRPLPARFAPRAAPAAGIALAL